MPYCTNCGSKVTVEMLFCHECGSKIIRPAAGPRTNNQHDYATDTEVNNREATPSQEPILSQRIKRSKLYKQWVKYAGLPTKEAPSIKSPRDMPVRGEGEAQHPRLFYILLGVGVLVCIGLAILLAKIW